MANDADVVALVTVADLLEPDLIMGSEPDDVTMVGRLVLAVEDHILDKSAPDEVTLRLISPYRLTADGVSELRAHLPLHEVLVLLEEYAEEPGSYVLLNGYSLWDETSRLPIDCPIALNLTEGTCFYERELSAADSVSDLAGNLRR